MDYHKIRMVVFSTGREGLWLGGSYDWGASQILFLAWVLTTQMCPLCKHL